MSGRRRHHEREARRRAIAERARLEALSKGVPVDPSALVPYNSYDWPEFVERGFYVDTPFVCEVCGKDQIWTAAQQKWWYEVAKGAVYSRATRCRSCRQEQRARRDAARLPGGDLNPYKNPGGLIHWIRSQIEPKLLSAGYRLVGRNERFPRRYLFLDYSRQDELLTISWDGNEGSLTADLLTEGGPELRVIATVNFSGMTTAHSEDGLTSFMKPMRSFLEGLGEGTGEPGPERDPSTPDNLPGT